MLEDIILEEPVHRVQPKNIAINVICPNTRHRIINQIIYEEFIRSVWFFKPAWANNVVNRLKDFNIFLSESAILNIKREIQTSKRDPISISNFSGGIFDGTYASRYGKDGMYKQFKLWVHSWIDKFDWSYVGLPANQILSVNREYGSINVHACEKNELMAKFMLSLQRHFSPAGDYAHIINADIFYYLDYTKNKFSIYDFDLMSNANSENFIETFVDRIVKTSKKKCVVNIATPIGRKISEHDYKQIMPREFVYEISKHMNVLGHYSDGYNDKIIPMRYEFFALERKEKNKQLELFN
jgi:hypothetical protein